MSFTTKWCPKCKCEAASTSTNPTHCPACNTLLVASQQPVEQKIEDSPAFKFEVEVMQLLNKYEGQITVREVVGTLHLIIAEVEWEYMVELKKQD